MILTFTQFLFKEPWFSRSDGFVLLSSSSSFSFPLSPTPSCLSLFRPSLPHSVPPSLPLVYTYLQFHSLVQIFLEVRVWHCYTISNQFSTLFFETLSMKHAILPRLAVHQASEIYLPRCVLPHVVVIVFPLGGGTQLPNKSDTLILTYEC